MSDDNNIKEVEKTAENVTPDSDDDKQAVNWTDEILEWLEAFVMAIFAVILIFIFFLRIVLVDGPSMNPTLTDGDRLILTHINYTPEKGDIVVLNCQGLQKTIIKRCIGTAGDTVRVDYNTGEVTVNGSVIEQDYLGEPMMDLNYFDFSYMTDIGVYEYTVPEDTIFVMGDNRNHSTDSRCREVGFVKTEDVLGKAFFRIMPFGSFGKIG